MYMYICIYRPNVKTKVIKTFRCFRCSLKKYTFAPSGVNSCYDCLFYFSSFV